MVFPRASVLVSLRGRATGGIGPRDREGDRRPRDGIAGPIFEGGLQGLARSGHIGTGGAGREGQGRAAASGASHAAGGDEADRLWTWRGLQMKTGQAHRSKANHPQRAYIPVLRALVKDRHGDGLRFQRVQLGGGGRVINGGGTAKDQIARIEAVVRRVAGVDIAAAVARAGEQGRASLIHSFQERSLPEMKRWGGENW